MIFLLYVLSPPACEESPKQKVAAEETGSHSQWSENYVLNMKEVVHGNSQDLQHNACVFHMGHLHLKEWKEFLNMLMSRVFVFAAIVFVHLYIATSLPQVYAVRAHPTK